MRMWPNVVFDREWVDGKALWSPGISIWYLAKESECDLTYKGWGPNPKTEGPTRRAGEDGQELHSLLSSSFFCPRFSFQRKKSLVGSSVGHRLPFWGGQTPICKLHPASTELYPMGKGLAIPQGRSEKMDTWEIDIFKIFLIRKF